MSDREYLMWLHERLVNEYGVPECADYMHKLRAIIKATPREQRSPNMVPGNSLEELKRESGDE